MAIVQVWDFQVKYGDGEKMAALLHQTLAQYQTPPGTPTYLSMKICSPSPTRLITMAEWKSLADMEQWFAAFGADPVGQEFWPKWGEFQPNSRGGQHWDVL
jgi:hypothetical protein